MKPSHLIIAAMSLVIIVLFVLIVKTKRKKAAEADAKGVTNNVLATVSTTTLVHPVTEEEMIISPSGVNSIDQGPGTEQMQSAISNVINEALQMSGTQPEYLTLNTYASSGKLMGSQTIANPYTVGVALASPAQEKIFEGTISYGCSKDQSLDGPGYYTDHAGDTLFGMYCN